MVPTVLPVGVTVNSLLAGVESQPHVRQLDCECVPVLVGMLESWTA